MTYLSFLLLFVILPIAVMALAFGDHITPRRWKELGILSLVALVWTTPWDNYLVANGIWWYDNHRVLGIALGYVPLEEYAFFMLQTLLTGMLLTQLMVWFPSKRAAFHPLPPYLGGLPVLALVGIVLGAAASNDPQWNYLILQLGWLALPPFAIQYIWGLDILLHYWRAVVPAIAIPTVWLSGMDALAINVGVWTIDPEQTVPLKLGGILPFEEALFFLITNMLIVQGLTLIVVPESWERLRHLSASILQRT